MEELPASRKCRQHAVGVARRMLRWRSGIVIGRREKTVTGSAATAVRGASRMRQADRARGWKRGRTIVATGGPHVEIPPLRQDDGPGAGRVWVTAGAQRRRRFDMRSPGPLRDRRRNRRYDVKRGLAGARGQAKPVRDSRLKSRGCGAKTGYARRFFGRIGESRLGPGLQRPARPRSADYGRIGRNCQFRSASQATMPGSTPSLFREYLHPASCRRPSEDFLGGVADEESPRPLRKGLLTPRARLVSSGRAIKSILGRVTLAIAPPIWMMVSPRRLFAGHIMVASDPLS